MDREGVHLFLHDDGAFYCFNLDKIYGTPNIWTSSSALLLCFVLLYYGYNIWDTLYLETLWTEYLFISRCTMWVDCL